MKWKNQTYTAQQHVFRSLMALGLAAFPANATETADSLPAPATGQTSEKQTFEVLNGTSCFKNFRYLDDKIRKSKSVETTPAATNSAVSKTEGEVLDNSDTTKNR